MTSTMSLGLRLPREGALSTSKAPLPTRFRGSAQLARHPQLVCMAVTSVPRKKQQPAGNRSVDEASSSASSLASVSGSMDAPTSRRRQRYDPDAAEKRSSLLSSFEDVYDDVLSSVHDVEEVVEEAWHKSAPGKAWAWYAQKLEAAPIRTKAVTSFFGFVIGDIMAQKIGGKLLS